jgi:pimeloyl-ACP methyl ester carboxylesterase
MPTTQRSGVAIHFESEGTGPPLVLLHGAYSSSETWRLWGYVGALRNERRLILIDARGHGQSDAPHDPAAYRLRELAADVVAVLDELGVASTPICGFSAGANTALWLGACATDRIDAVAALSPGPERVGFTDVPAPPPDDDLAERFDQDGMAWLVAKLEAEGRLGSARIVARTDPLSMAALLRGLDMVDPIDVALKTYPVPLLVAWEELVEGDQELLPPGARLVVVPGDHVGLAERSDVILPELRSFLTSVATRGQD